jgi:hypothetical protein
MRAGARVYYLSNLFGGHERNYARVVTGNVRMLKEEGLGHLVPQLLVQHEDDGMNYWHPIKKLKVVRGDS